MINCVGVNTWRPFGNMIIFGFGSLGNVSFECVEDGVNGRKNNERTNDNILL